MSNFMTLKGKCASCWQDLWINWLPEKGLKIPALRKSSGFTMIEAIAVLLLLGILSAVIISSYPSTESNTLVAEELTLKGHLRFAQLRAMNDQVSWGIALSANAYTLLQNGAPAPYDLPGEDSRTHSFPGGISITVGAGTTVSFDQWGSPGPASIIITLSAGMDARAIPITRNTGFIP